MASNVTIKERLTELELELELEPEARSLLVTGQTGLVGSRFIELLFSPEILIPTTRNEFDITNGYSAKRFLEKTEPQFLINFAAYTNVGEAEKERGNKDALCWRTNVVGVENIIEAIAGTQTKFVQISTDMVFSGSEDNLGPYSPNHKPETDSQKLTWYGFTKAEAERVILDRLGDKATILRIMYPVRAKFNKKGDYLRNMLQKYDAGSLPPAFTDQQVTITFIDDVCVTLNKIISQDLTGVFQIASDLTNPFDLFLYTLQKTGRPTGKLVKGSLKDMIENGKLNPVRYPLFGGLRTENPHPWKEIVDKLVEQGITV